jgi:hypothetical protein
MVLALAGCTEHGKSPDGGAGKTDAPPPEVCEIDFQAALSKGCMVPADCSLVDHDDCCGTIKVAVTVGTEADARKAEAAWGICRACPPVGCAHADQSEDRMVPGTGQAIVARCVSNRCTSTVAP